MSSDAHVPGPVADDDPLLTPIAGIDLGRYAQLTKAIGHYGLRTQAQVDEYVARAGHSPQQWQEASDGWTARFRADMGLSMVYAQHFHAAQV